MGGKHAVSLAEASNLSMRGSGNEYNHQARAMGVHPVATLAYSGCVRRKLFLPYSAAVKSTDRKECWKAWKAAFQQGDPDKPSIMGSAHNRTQVPMSFSDASVLPNEKALSGLWSRMYRGAGGNELIFDDTTEQLRTRIASDHAASRLNLGYLVQPRSGSVGTPRGEGFDLRTEAWGGVRMGKGLLITHGLGFHCRNHLFRQRQVLISSQLQHMKNISTVIITREVKVLIRQHKNI